MNDILHWLVTAEDPRQQAKVKHLMKDIIAIVFFAELAMREFDKEKHYIYTPILKGTCMNTILMTGVEEHPHTENHQQGKNKPALFTRLRNKFISKPSRYYSMSIAATWAGVGSLMVGMQMAQNFGIVPFLLWAFGNTVACITFGLFAPSIPKLREVFRSRPMLYLMGLMCVFQIWLNMNGIHSIFEGTPLTGTFGLVLAYATALFFLFLLIKNGVIRNVFTDNGSWSAVYGVVLLLTILAIIYSRGNMNALSWGLEAGPLWEGAQRMILLIPGPFLYPYYFMLLDFNDQNEFGAKKVDIRRSFIIGGLLFGVYLAFVFLLAWTHFSPTLSVIRAFLIFLIASSTVSAFLYGIYITFGRKAGIVINLAAVGFWQLLIPMGVLGVWTLMASIRIHIVIGAILIAVSWHLWEQKKTLGRKTT